MTREEAITVLKAFMKNPLFSEVHKAAFNIAIHDIKAYQDWNINNLILVNKDNYEPTTKNDLGVDCISRADAIGCLAGQIELSPSNVASVHEYLKCVNKRLHDLPSVTPQEPFKPMVEIDLDYVIKQKYIEREVLDKIRAEILEEHENAYAREDDDTAYGLSMALDILDKYKAETEDQE